MSLQIKPISEFDEFCKTIFGDSINILQWINLGLFTY